MFIQERERQRQREREGETVQDAIVWAHDIYLEKANVYLLTTKETFVLLSGAWVCVIAWRSERVNQQR